MELIEVGCVREFQVKEVTGDGTLGCRRPRRGLCPERFGIRRHHASPCIDLLPTHAELTPVLEMSVFKTDRREGSARPGVCPGHVGGAGETWADAICQSSGKFHDMRVMKAFLTDTRIHGRVNSFSRGLRSIEGRVFAIGGANWCEKTESDRCTEGPTCEYARN